MTQHITAKLAAVLGTAFLAPGLVIAVSATAAQAGTGAALQDGTTIARIDTQSRKVTGSAKLDGGARLVGIGLRPADGKAIFDGRLKYAEGDKGKGLTPKVTAAAYTDSVAGTKTTALYDIDAANGWLLKQAPPNDGVLVTVGPTGVKAKGPMALDILADGKGGNAAWLLADGKLYEIDLKTGNSKSLGGVKGLTGTTWDMAILPPA